MPVSELHPSVRILAVLALVLVAGSCDPGGEPGGGASSARTGDPHAEGRRLYLTRCTACHAPEPLGDYSAAEWRSIIPDMAIESKLTASQQEAVLNYVLSGASN